mmetsp:Transcript_38302/g.119595  ORF Transcript_38302/g.119595 Transcript_38302/m.119595 type:complete len:441 (+) Transcript_38302:823-2145(+)
MWAAGAGEERRAGPALLHRDGPNLRRRAPVLGLLHEGRGPRRAGGCEQLRDPQGHPRGPQAGGPAGRHAREAAPRVLAHRGLGHTGEHRGGAEHDHPLGGPLRRKDKEVCFGAARQAAPEVHPGCRPRGPGRHRLPCGYPERLARGPRGAARALPAHRRHDRGGPRRYAGFRPHGRAQGQGGAQDPALDAAAGRGRGQATAARRGQPGGRRRPPGRRAAAGAAVHAGRGGPVPAGREGASGGRTGGDHSRGPGRAESGGEDHCAREAVAGGEHGAAAAGGGPRGRGAPAAGVARGDEEDLQRVRADGGPAGQPGAGRAREAGSGAAPQRGDAGGPSRRGAPQNLVDAARGGQADARAGWGRRRQPREQTAGARRVPQGSGGPHEAAGSRGPTGKAAPGDGAGAHRPIARGAKAHLAGARAETSDEGRDPRGADLPDAKRV